MTLSNHSTHTIGIRLNDKDVRRRDRKMMLIKTKKHFINTPNTTYTQLALPSLPKI